MLKVLQRSAPFTPGYNVDETWLLDTIKLGTVNKQCNSLQMLRNKILLSTTVHVAHEMPALIISTSNFDLHFLQVNSPFSQSTIWKCF
jgi:hypothetical protein